jgi:hypothetical protein
MKRTSIIIILFLAGFTVFAQDIDMSYYTEEYNRADVTVFDLLDILEVVRNENYTGIGDFYYNALRVLFYRLPNFETNLERLAVHDSARIILRGLAAERHTEAAPYVWTLIQHYDVVHDYNDGLLMHEALITMGLIDAKEYAPHIALRLENFNADQTSDLQTRRRIQLGVTGAISALEALQEPEGIKPVFFASIGWYDPEIRAIASAALPNIMEDPGTIISEIIHSPFNGPRVKYTAWQEMLQTRAPDSSKAKVAAVALETSFTYITPSLEYQRVLRDMRLSAIDTIRKLGVEDDSVYAYLERTYREAFTPNPDFEAITLVINTLSAIRTDEAVELLTEFLRGLHNRRRSGPWGTTERDIMQITIPAIANTGTQSLVAKQLLTTIQRSTAYTGAEHNWAESALKALVR